MKKQFWYALALLSGVTCGSIASAQQPGSDVDELRARLDRLEQQNMELRQAVAQRLPAVDPDDNGAGQQQFTSLNGFNAAPEDDKMKAAIQKYMKEQDDKKKAEAEAKKAAGYEVASDLNATGKWTNDGLTFGTPNGDFKYHMRGLAQLDFNNLQTLGPSIGSGGGQNTTDSVNFRRLRLGAEGTMYETIDWVFEFDFAFALQNVDPTLGASPSTGLRSTPTAGGAPLVPLGSQAGNTMGTIQPTTIFMTFKDMPVLGNVRVGNQQSWISQEHIESARFTDFMERAVIMDAFSGPNNNGYAPGISAFNNTENKRMGMQVGVYKNTCYDSGYAYDYGNTNFTYGGRIIGTPYYDEESHGRYLLHVGLGSEYRVFNNQPAGSQNGDNVRIRVRGDVRNGVNTLDPNFADTGNFYADSQTVVNPEFAFQWGSLLLQGEYSGSFMGSARAYQTGPSLGATYFQGGYVSAMYFFTGENRVYNRQTGVFGRVVPIENAFIAKGASSRGSGAWQGGIRYDWVDLNNANGTVRGGQNQNITLGLNWFLNSNSRFQFNYVMSHVDSVAGGAFPGSPTNAANVAGSGNLQGSKFTGDGFIHSFGARFDFNF